jgi:hypothetical protein
VRYRGTTIDLSGVRITPGTRAVAGILAIGLAAASMVGVSLATAASSAAADPSTGAATFTSTGYDTCSDGTYLVPQGITQLKIMAQGAVGGDGADDPQGVAGGKGGPGTEVDTTVNVTPGQVLNVNVADPFGGVFTTGSGFGGPPGGATNEGPVNVGGYGGDASWVSVGGTGCSPVASSLLVVAAGGGGGGGAATGAQGGNGGNETVSANGGNGGSNREDDGAGGSGATTTNHGTGGAAGHNSGSLAGCRAGQAGGDGVSLDGGYGGQGGSDPGDRSGCQGANSQSGAGGGGGAGYFGGGGGGGGDDNANSGAAAGGGGGAGASYVISGSTSTTIKRAFPPGDGNQFAGVITIKPVDTPPTIVSTNTFTFVAGTAIPSTAITRAAGWPLPLVGYSGDIPDGVQPTSGFDGEATLTGTPDASGYGVHHMTATATNTDGNGQQHQATQPITITVDSAATFQNPSGSKTNMAVGTAASFTVGTIDTYPVAQMGVTGTLPPGISFTDNGNGTETLHGTPTAGGIFPITFTASNGFGPTVTQNIEVDVTPIPTTVTVSSNANPSVSGQSVTFSAKITPNPGNSPAVEFFIDGQTNPTIITSNSSGVATLPANSTLAVGTHTITATMPDDGTYSGSSGTLIQHVGVTTAAYSGTTITASGPSTSLFYADNLLRQHFPQGDVATNFEADGPLAFGRDGAIYGVSDNRLFRSINGTDTIYGPQLGSVQGIAVDAAGDVFVAQFNTLQTLIKVAPDGTSTSLLSGNSLWGFDVSWFPTGVAVDAAGNLFFTDASDNGHIAEIAPPYTGAPTSIATANLFNTIGDLAIDSYGDMFVFDSNHKTVQEVSVSSGLTTTVATGISGLQSVTVDSAGTLYLGTSSAVYSLPAPYNGVPTLVDSGHSFKGLATSTSSTAAAGDPVTLTATTVSSPAGPFPAGTVTFKEGTTTLGTATVDANGNAALTLSNLAVGVHSITANYGGNTIYPASTSQTFSVTITLPLVPVTVSGTRPFGSSTVTYTPSTGTLPSGVTGISGTLSGCTTSTGTATALGFYTGTMGGCSGLSLTGSSAANYQISYVDGGVTVGQGDIPVTVLGNQVLGASATFSYTNGTLPSGITLTGTLAGCSTTVLFSDPVGSYPGTLSGCTGLTPSGTSASNYTVSYVDGGVTVALPAITVTVTGSKPFGGGVTTAFSFAAPTSLPAGVSLSSGPLTGCTAAIGVTTGTGSYQGKISGCSGLTLSGPTAADYRIVYVDGGVTVTPRSMTFVVTATQFMGGTPVFRYGVLNSPTDLSFIDGSLTGCTTTVTAFSAVGSYAGTISGCSGISFGTTDGVTYPVSYVDGGVTVGNQPTSTSLVASGAPAQNAIVGGNSNQIVSFAAPYTGGFSVLSAGLVVRTNALATTSNGSIIVGSPVSGSSNSVLTVLTSTGALVSTTPIAGGLVDVAVDSHDNVFALLGDGLGTTIVEWAAPYTGTPVTILSGLIGAYGITFDKADAMFIDTNGGRSLLELPAPYGGAPAQVYQSTQIIGAIAVDVSDNLYFANANSQMVKVAPPYTAAPSVVGTGVTGAAIPGHMAFDRLGTLYWTTQSGGEWRLSAGVASRFDASFANGQGGALAFAPVSSSVDYGTSVTLTATVGSPSGGTLDGTVTFYDGFTILGTAPVMGSTATITTSTLDAGPHDIVANYQGTSSYAASSSSSQLVTIGQRPISFPALSAATVGDAATLSASSTVSSNPVTFSVDATTSPAGACTVSGTTVTYIHVGTCVLDADQQVDAGTTAPPTTSQSVAISPASLTMTASNATMVYGATPPAVTASFSGFRNGDTAAVLTTAPTCGADIVARTTSCSGAVAADYTITPVAGVLTETAAQLTVTASAGTMVYGGTLPTITPVYSGFVNGDVASHVTTGSTCAADSVTRTTSCSGGVAADYTLVFVPGVLTVTPATLTVTASSESMVYGGTIPAVKPIYSGFVNGDVATHVTVVPSCVADAVARTTSCSGGVAPDYVFSYVPGALIVTPVILTVTGSNETMVYGGTVPAVTPVYSGFVNGDVASHVTTAPICTADPVARTTSCSGGVAADYTIVPADGLLTVTPATLTVTASAGTMVYGGTLPHITPSYSGFVNGDSASHVTTAPTCLADPVTRTTGCTGGIAADYTLVPAAGVLTVTPAALTVTASDSTMVYGGTPSTVTPRYSGLVNGDTGVATPPICTTDQVAMTTSCVGAADADYTVTAVDGAFTVTPAPLTVSAPDLSVRRGSSLPAIVPTYSGFVNGESATSLGLAAVCTTTASASSAAGVYPIICSGVSDADYAVSYVPGDVTVTSPASAGGTSSPLAESPDAVSSDAVSPDAASPTTSPVPVPSASSSMPHGSPTGSSSSPRASSSSSVGTSPFDWLVWLIAGIVLLVLLAGGALIVFRRRS